jgi:hypothetical protein
MKANYSTRKKFRCSMLTIVFKTAAMKEKYPGGVRKFGMEYYIEYNRDIAMHCEMGSTIDEICKKLIKERFIYLEDFFVFDASGHLGIPWIKDKKPVEFPVDWIRGYIRGPATMVYFNDGQREEVTSPPDTGGDRSVLRAREIY